MIKCIKCNREAEFDSPEDFCKFHWLEWWHDGAGPSFAGDEPERQQKEELLLRLIKADKPEDRDIMESLYSEYNSWMQENATESHSLFWELADDGKDNG